MRHAMLFDASENIRKKNKYAILAHAHYLWTVWCAIDCCCLPFGTKNLKTTETMRSGPYHARTVLILGATMASRQRWTWAASKPWTRDQGLRCFQIPHDPYEYGTAIIWSYDISKKKVQCSLDGQSLLTSHFRCTWCIRWCACCLVERAWWFCGNNVSLHRIDVHNIY
jgi:hypothetical protein